MSFFLGDLRSVFTLLTSLLPDKAYPASLLHFTMFRPDQILAPLAIFPLGIPDIDVFELALRGGQVDIASSNIDFSLLRHLHVTTLPQDRHVRLAGVAV